MAKLRKVILYCLSLIIANSCNATEKDLLSPDPAAMKRWQNMRFGMFIHWGPVSMTGYEIGWSRGRVRRKKHNLEQYTEYLKAQVKELIVNYGPLVTLWYDVPQEFNDARGKNIIRHTRSLQPDIIINNRTGKQIELNAPKPDRDPIATIIEFTMDGKAFDIEPINVAPYKSGSAAFGKQARASNIFQKNEQYAPSKAIDDATEGPTIWEIQLFQKK